ncbi:hypothetical protein ACFX12_045943 [Malus domestica]
MLDPKWARTSLHKQESASVTARLQSSEPTGKDEGKKLRSARKRRIPSRSRSGEEFEWVLLVSTLSTLSENQGFRCEEEEEEVVGPCPDQGEWSSLSDLLHCHRLHKL